MDSIVFSGYASMVCMYYILAVSASSDNPLGGIGDIAISLLAPSRTVLLSEFRTKSVHGKKLESLK